MTDRAHAHSDDGCRLRQRLQQSNLVLCYLRNSRTQCRNRSLSSRDKLMQYWRHDESTHAVTGNNGLGTSPSGLDCSVLQADL